MLLWKKRKKRERNRLRSRNRLINSKRTLHGEGEKGPSKKKKGGGGVEPEHLPQEKKPLISLLIPRGGRFHIFVKKKRGGVSSFAKREEE